MKIKNLHLRFSLMQLKPEYHRYLFMSGLGMMLIGLPFSEFLMSISQFILVGNWLWEGGVKKKINIFFANKTAVLLSSVFLLHLLGLFHTHDFDYALNDLRIKLPILILPLVLASSPALTRKEFTFLTGVFIAALVASSITCASLFFYGNSPSDTREMSIFISHIRYSLMICLGIFFLFHYLNLAKSWRNKLLISAAAAWLACFLFILNSFTGIVIFIATGYAALLYATYNQQKPRLKYALILTLVTVPLLLACFIYVQADSFYKVKTAGDEKLDSYTPAGNPYFHNFENHQLENGHYVWRNICWKELEEQWNSRSDLDYNGKDRAGQLLHATLIRFLSSKGLRKDAEGVQQLSSAEIKAIEKGIANYRFMDKQNLKTRIYQLIWELDNYRAGGNPEGNSVAQRFEFWKAATAISAQHLWIGTGTGDVQQAFNKHYATTGSKLSQKYWLRAHNQYLTILVTFGIIGFIWFMCALFYPVLFNQQARKYFFLIFYIIALLSFINEDTLETQAGVTFFTFFFCFLLFQQPSPATADRD